MASPTHLEDPRPLRLGVVDQSPIPTGMTAGDALANSVDLARHCDRLGYSRYWLAEHHNSNGLAGSAPEILIGRIAAATDRIRVGSGGVMLSHYAPYKVAETFRTLAAMFPDRIDLGIGRAPGSDQYTMFALATNREPTPVDSYPSMVEELLGFLEDDLPADSPFRGRVRAVPGSDVASPPVWMLSSSPGSAGFAAHFGLPLSYAHFFGMGDGVAIVDSYRRNYQASAAYPDPIVNAAVGVVCAETDEEAQRLATSVTAWRNRGLSGPIPTIAEAAAVTSPLAVSSGRKPMVIGSPSTVRAGLEALAAEYRTDELLVVTIVWDHEARVRSYELMAQEFGLHVNGRRDETADGQPRSASMALS